MRGSDVTELRNFISIKNDTNKNNMHHKFFIIDGQIVITGSMNPSASGTKYNDESLLIVDNKNFAKLYLEEFENLYN